MSQPRHIVPRDTYLITRRVVCRTFLLRPDAIITQIVLYALAVSATRFGMQVHAFCTMSNHLHLIVTDSLGVLPDFLHFFNRLVALCTKVFRAWEGSLWDSNAASVVRLTTRAAVVEKIAYVLANPVAAGLVPRADEWPGAKVSVGELGRGMLHAKRPKVYLDPENPTWPEEATLPLTLPPIIEQDDATRFRDDVADELLRLEGKVHAEMWQKGRSFLGAKQIMAVSPHDRATSVEPQRGRNPTFAVGRDQHDLGLRAAAAVRAFRAEYREALERWREGVRCDRVRNVVFPAGTWWMRVFHGAAVHDATPAA
jgi:putative transposase